MRRVIFDESEVHNVPPSGYNLVLDSLFRDHQYYKTRKVYYITLKDLCISKELVFWRGLNVLEETYLNIEKGQYFEKWSYQLKHIALNIFKRRKRNLNETYLWAIDRFSQGYYHWVTETLPRLLYLKREGCSTTLLLTTRYAERKYVHESLELLKIDKQYYDNNDSYAYVHRLCTITPFADTGLHNPKIIRELRQTLCDLMSINTNSNVRRRIYVSRRKASKRKLKNEDEIDDVLVEYGIETIYFEDYSFMEQGRIASESELMIGLHGSGLTNCLFMRPGSSLLEIRNDSDPNFCFYNLSRAADLNYYFLAYKTEEWAMTRCEIEVDMNEFRRFIKKICENA